MATQNDWVPSVIFGTNESLLQESFASYIAWGTPSPFTSAIDTWQFKNKLFRKKVKGWSINLEAAMKKKKKKKGPAARI